VNIIQGDQKTKRSEHYTGGSKRLKRVNIIQGDQKD